MHEGSTEKDSDLRAGKAIAALRLRLSYTPERMAPMAGVGASTIRAIEKQGVIPHLATQEKLARFFAHELHDPTIRKETIWTRPPLYRPRRRKPAVRLRNALESARGDVSAAAARLELPPGNDFLYGVAWAVIRSQNPFAPPEVVAEKAQLAVLGG